MVVACRRSPCPCNDEEITLYWTNHDQYYVKTAEHFIDYTWEAPNGVTVTAIPISPARNR